MRDFFRGYIAFFRDADWEYLGRLAGFGSIIVALATGLYLLAWALN